MPDSSAFSLPASTDFFEASTWTSRAPGRRHGQRADAGIAEQVERLARRRPAVRASTPIAAPCRGRKRGGGTGVHLGAEADLLPAQLPAFARHRPAELPAAAAFLVGAGDELAVGVPVGLGRAPTSPAARGG